MSVLFILLAGGGVKAEMAVSCPEEAVICGEQGVRGGT